MKRETIFKEGLSLAVKIYGVKEKNILSRKRKRNFVDARKLIVYFMREKYGLGWTEMAKMFDMNHSSVIHMYNGFLSDSKYDKRVKSCRVEVDNLVDTTKWWKLIVW